LVNIPYKISKIKLGQEETNIIENFTCQGFLSPQKSKFQAVMKWCPSHPTSAFEYQNEYHIWYAKAKIRAKKF